MTIKDGILDKLVLGKKILKSILPQRERRKAAGQFLPFCSCIELDISTHDFYKTLENLPKTCQKVPKNFEEFYQILNDTCFDAWSVFSHELVHFGQMLSVPIIMDYCFEMRWIIDWLIELIVREKENFRYPVKLELQHEYTAINMCSFEHPLVNMNLLHLTECLALYYQLILNEYEYSEPWVSFIMEGYEREKIGAGVYSNVYKDLYKFWGVKEAFFLLPLIIWTSLSQFHLKNKKDLMHSQKKELIHPVDQFIIFAEFLSNNPKYRKNLFEILIKSNYDHSEVFDSFIEMIYDKIDIEFEFQKPAYIDIVSFLSKTNGYKEEDYFYFFPQAFYYEKSFSLNENPMKFFMQKFRFWQWKELKEKILFPPIITTGENIVNLNNEIWENNDSGINLNKLTSYQYSYFTANGIIESILSSEIDMKCPHKKCPYYRQKLCSSFNKIPKNFHDCEFPDQFRKLTGIELGSVKERSNKYSSSLLVDFVTRTYQYKLLSDN